MSFSPTPVYDPDDDMEPCFDVVVEERVEDGTCMRCGVVVRAGQYWCEEHWPPAQVFEYCFDCGDMLDREGNCIDCGYEAP